MERVLFAPRGLPPLPADAAQDLRRYDAWVRARERTRVAGARRRGHPKLGLILIVGDGPAVAVRRTLTSLRGQRSARWSLSVVAPHSRLDDVGSVVRAIVPWRKRHACRLIGVPDGAPARDSLVRALAQHVDDTVGLLFPGDAWAPDAVALLGAAVTPDGAAYADEDIVGDGGDHVAPRLKPDHSPDLHLSTAFVGRPLVFGVGLARHLSDLVADDMASLEHECALIVCRAARRVRHLPEVLCHRSVPPEAPSGDAYLSRFVGSEPAPATVVPGRWPGTFHVGRDISPGTTVSVIVPFRDQPRFLRTCVDSVRATAGGLVRLELVLIDNGTTDPETQTLVERLAGQTGVQVVRDDRPFNWAQLNNAGARAAAGDVLLFLNNDIEARRAGWLEALCAHALRPGVGAAGARLLYPDGRLQHCGVVVGLGGAAGHPLAGLPGDESGYLHMAAATRECSAVTGACLATRRDLFDELGGFDETLGVDLNDVDFCLRAATKGFRTVYEPDAELIHYESPSRGTAGGVGDIVHFIERWKDYIERRDPYLNVHLTRADPSCRLADDHEEEQWNRWFSTTKAG